MASLPTKSFTDLVRGQVAAIQANAAGLVDFTVGSILRAIVESIAFLVLWLQGLVLQLLVTTRAATASGSDLDSWMADFGVTRLAASFATGSVTFSRFSTVGQVVVPVGATVQTADGSQQFTVNLDTTNPVYSASLGGFVMAGGVGAVTVSVTAVTAGTGANVTAGAISTITSAVSGVDTVTNASAFTNGQNAETDAALRVRFVSYIQSLSKATVAAIQNAIVSVQQGLTYTITENAYYNGTPQIGHFSVVFDDGSGNPSSTLQTTVYNAINAVRPIGSTFEVHGPTVVTANVVMTLTVVSPYVKATVGAAVQAAITTYINSLPLGASLPFTRLAQIAYDTSPGVTNVTALTLNSGTSDLSATVVQVVRAGAVTVNTP